VGCKLLRDEYGDGIADPVRVMLEQGRSKRVVACAFDWPGWDRSTRTGEDVLAVLAAYRPGYAKVAELAGFGAEFEATGELEVVERLEGIGMTDYYGLSGRAAAPENDPMTEADCERKTALLQASWSTFDDVAARVPPELRRGPHGGGWDKDRIIRHVNGAEIDEFAPKVGVRVPLGTRDDAEALRAYRDAFIEAIREHHGRGEPARSWALPFLIRRCAWHMLDHAWELEDRDLTNARAYALTAGRRWSANLQPRSVNHIGRPRDGTTTPRILIGRTRRARFGGLESRHRAGGGYGAGTVRLLR